MEILYTSAVVREVKKYTVPEFVEFVKETEGLDTDDINDFWGQEGKDIEYIYQATETINNDEVIDSCFAGIEFTDGTFFVYGCRRDSQVRDESTLIQMLVQGF